MNFLYETFPIGNAKFHCLHLSKRKQLLISCRCTERRYPTYIAGIAISHHALLLSARQQPTPPLGRLIQHRTVMGVSRRA